MAKEHVEHFKHVIQLISIIFVELKILSAQKMVLVNEIITLYKQILIIFNSFKYDYRILREQALMQADLHLNDVRFQVK